ncbi:hypothetical protein HK405_006974, partial [Cladochytrium tenue]
MAATAVAAAVPSAPLPPPLQPPQADPKSAPALSMLASPTATPVLLETLLMPPLSSEDTLATELRVIDAIASVAATVIKCAPPTPTSTPVPPMREFVELAIGSPPRRSRHGHHDTSITRRSILLTTLVYLDRLKKTLPASAKGMSCTAHRIFLAALLVATKFLQDPPIKNRQWAGSSSASASSSRSAPDAHDAPVRIVSARRIFSLPELNLMERQFLFLIGFDLLVTKEQAADALLEHVPAAVLFTSPSSSPS